MVRRANLRSLFNARRGNVIVAGAALMPALVGAAGLGTDTMTLAVGRPPRDLSAATAIAAEHYAFCSDNIDQGVGSIGEYADSLVNESVWPFWWD